MFSVSPKPPRQKKFLVKKDVRAGNDNYVKEKEKPFFGLNSQFPPKRFKVRLSVIRDIQYQQPKQERKAMKWSKEAKTKKKRSNREGMYNCGRWMPEEHKRFIEAIFKFGNEWKQVQKQVGTRSSTQARSHAQKFFVKVKKANVLDLHFDITKNSIKTLHDMANCMNSDAYSNAINALNCAAYERKGKISKKRQKKDETVQMMNISSETEYGVNEAQSTLNLNGDEMFNDQSMFFSNSRITSEAVKSTQREKDTLSPADKEVKQMNDEMEYIDHFNCTFKEDMFKLKNEFEVEKELEDVIMLSHSQHEVLTCRNKDENSIFDLMSMTNVYN